MPSRTSDQDGSLSLSEFLDELRRELRSIIRSDAITELRLACDLWTIGGARIDPVDPLVNRGRSTINWPSESWHSISVDLLGALDREIRDGAGWTSPHLAAYVGFVHLELCAREEPALGVRPGAILLPCVAYARHHDSPALFRRYLIGWLARASSHPWNADELSVRAAIAVALGSITDSTIRPQVEGARRRLDSELLAGRRLRDIAPADERALWREVAAGSAPDAASWASAHLA